MKKIVSKLKKIFGIASAYLLLVRNRIFGIVNPQPLYGVNPIEEEPISKLKKLLIIIRTYIIPFVFIIGVIAYFKKSKSSTKKKIILSIIAFIIACIIYVVMNNIITNLS